MSSLRPLSALFLALFLLAVGPASAQSDGDAGQTDQTMGGEASTAESEGTEDPVPAEEGDIAGGEDAAPQLDPETTARIEALLTTLEDDAERTALVDHLRTLLSVADPADAEETVGDAAVSLVTTNLTLISQQISATIELVTDLPQLITWFQVQYSSPVPLARWKAIGEAMGFALGAGLLALFGLQGVIRGPRDRLRKDAEGGHTAQKIGRGLLIAILSLLPLVGLAVLTTIVLSTLDPTYSARIVVLTLVYSIVIVGVVGIAARAVLQPYIASIRPVDLTDLTAAYLYVWIMRLTRISVIGFVISEIAVPIGLPSSVATGLLTIIGLMIALLLIIFVLQNRRNFREVLRELADRSRELEHETGASALLVAMIIRRSADVWHGIAILYVLVGFGIWALHVEGGFRYLAMATLSTVVAILIGWMIFTLAKRGLRRTLIVAPELAAINPGLEKRANRYISVANSGLKIVITALTILVIAHAWGLQALSWLQSDLGAAVVRAVVSITVVIVAALAIWEFVDGAIQKRLAALAENDGAGSARLRTLLPLARSVLIVVLVTVVVLIVMSELGLDIAPLLAGAGVVGLAIGFGSQSLVRDVITGLFILLEDTIKVGDVVDVAGHVGTVEGLSIRSVRLRDLSGAVHTVPFGDVSSVLNMTKDFSYYVMDIGIAYREDVESVMQVIKEVGDDLYNDEAYGAVMLDTVEILGLDSFGDSAVNIKARLKTLPIKQWMVGREYNKRLKKRFDELGIEIPFPHQTIYFGVDRDGSAPAARMHVQAPALIEALSGGPGRLHKSVNDPAPDLSRKPAADITPDRIDDGDEH